jgi:hypothetical protein
MTAFCVATSNSRSQHEHRNSRTSLAPANAAAATRKKVLPKFNIKPLVRLAREEAAAIDWENNRMTIPPGGSPGTSRTVPMAKSTNA